MVSGPAFPGLVARRGFSGGAAWNFREKTLSKSFRINLKEFK
jgi:hypothetical protein